MKSWQMISADPALLPPQLVLVEPPPVEPCHPPQPCQRGAILLSLLGAQLFQLLIVEAE